MEPVMNLAVTAFPRDFLSNIVCIERDLFTEDRYTALLCLLLCLLVTQLFVCTILTYSVTSSLNMLFTMFTMSSTSEMLCSKFIRSSNSTMCLVNGWSWINAHHLGNTFYSFCSCPFVSFIHANLFATVLLILI